jgi:aldose sugar dehydrogenase
MRTWLGVVAMTALAVMTQGQDLPRIFNTYTPGPCSPNGQDHGGCPPGTLVKIRVSKVASGLVRPWQIAFLSGGDMLVSENAGRLRLIHDGVLDPQPVGGWPGSLPAEQLYAVVVHPKYAQNKFVYLTYQKKDGKGNDTLALARGRFEGNRLVGVDDIFVSEAWSDGGSVSGRAAFGPDGMIYIAIGDRDKQSLSDDPKFRMAAQDLSNDIGKILRLRDDGTVPPDNPFVGRPGARPEIYTYGHRNAFGLAWDQQTGRMYETEIGPMGGDELNILRPGKNYGWPLVSFGRIYTSNPVSDQSWYREGMEMPAMFWVPAISPSGLIVYTGDRFPLWKGHLFSGSLSGQQLLRIAFNQPLPQTERRESMLTQLGIRVRDVQQGPDGLIYITTEAPTNGPGPASNKPDGMVLKIEPAE